MNNEVEIIVKGLEGQVIELHYRWSIYKELFARDRETIDLTNRHGSNFFHYAQKRYARIY